jgi:NAD(P)-dependent dehydrogenase (short-subunit alcohol dehydrogenase family)
LAAVDDKSVHADPVGRGLTTVETVEPRTVLVVGASRGIGLVISGHLVAQGWQVTGTVRSPSDEASLREAGITPLVLDVTDHTAVAALGDQVDRLDALVYNAGLSVAGPVELLDVDLAQAEVNVNYVGAAAVTKALLPALRASQGHIVYVTSVNGSAPVGLYASYSASKFALEGFAEALAIEVAGTGVTVTVIEPGICNTDMLPQDIAVLEAKLAQAPDYLVPQLEDTTNAIKVLKPNDPQVVARAVGKVLAQNRPRFRVVAPRVPYAIMTLGHRLLPLGGYRRLVALSTPKRRGK